MSDTNPQPADTSTPWLSNKAYGFLKFLAMIALPALGTLYFALAQIWGLPGGEQVVGTVIAVDTFLGVVLGISSAQYNQKEANAGFTGPLDGVMTVHHDENRNVHQFHLEVDGDPLDLINRDTITFKVDPQQISSTPGDLPQTGYVPPSQ